MRIVHVTPFYTPVIGGVENVVKKIAEHMALRGWEVFVVTYNRLRGVGANVLPKYDVVNGVRVIRLKPDIMWSHGTYSSELPQVIRELKPDIVHVHVWRHPHVFQVAKLKSTMKFKVILHGHAPFHGLDQLGLPTWIYHRLVDKFGRGCLRFYDVYIALTPYEAERVRRLGLSDRVIVIPNGIEKDGCVLDESIRGDYDVLYLGRVSKSKNLDLLVKSMEFVMKDIRKVRLIIAGPDEGLARKLISYAKRKSIRVEYLGPVSEEEKHKLYIESMMYALPSLYEPFGITLLEAGIHGTPSVITGDGGQIFAAPPGIASLWAKPDLKSYAEAIITLLTDKKLWKKLSEGAKNWAQQHVWDRILPKYEKLYSELSQAT